MNNARTFQACRNDLCNHGHAPCPTPQACQVPEADDMHGGIDILPWLTVRRFWIGYALGIASALLGPHLWARLA